jgi:diguanylate cyclase (GGDEF)-like protein/PAS domain S-box-containing protein
MNEAVYMNNENAISNNELMYRASFEHSNTAICHLSLEHTFIRINIAFRNLFGIDEKKLLDLRIKDLCNKSDMNLYNNEYMKLINGEKESIQFDKLYIKNDKSVFWARIKASLIKDLKGNAIFISAYIEDISKQKENDELLKISQERYQLSFDLSPDAININRSSDGLYLEINQGFTSLLGYTFDDVKNKSSLELDIWVNPNDRNKLVEELRTNKFCTNLEAEFKTKSGDIHVALMSASIISINDEDCILSITRDITERKLLENEIFEKKELLDITLSSVGDGVISTDLNGNIVLINKVAQCLTGYLEIEAVGLHFNQVFPIINEYTHIKNENPITKVLETGNIIGLANHTLLLSKDGKEIPIEDSAAPIRDTQGKIHGVVLVFRDVTIERMRQKEKEYVMSHDQLTGLYNRNYFTKKLEEYDINADYPISIIMADVNGLKLTNDTFGHLVGDELLIKTARVLKSICGDYSIVARLGGDEFAFLMQKTTNESAHLIINQIKNAIGKEKINYIPMSIGLGCETKNDSNDNLNIVLKKAEDKMYADKLFDRSIRKSSTVNIIMNSLHENNQEKHHAERVSMICEAIGTSIGMTPDKVKELKTIGFLHDIGKVAVSEEIINKKGPLNKGEYDEVKRHSEIGFRILNSVIELSELSQYVLYHHERFDGKGYPKGLTKESIPIESRIIAIADSFDAMTSDRPYRKALSKEQAIYELIQNSNTQFDSKLVEVFISNVLPQIQ